MYVEIKPCSILRLPSRNRKSRTIPVPRNLRSYLFLKLLHLFCPWLLWATPTTHSSIFLSWLQREGMAQSCWALRTHFQLLAPFCLTLPWLCSQLWQWIPRGLGNILCLLQASPRDRKYHLCSMPATWWLEMPEAAVGFMVESSLGVTEVNRCSEQLSGRPACLGEEFSTQRRVG